LKLFEKVTKEKRKKKRKKKRTKKGERLRGPNLAHARIWPTAHLPAVMRILARQDDLRYVIMFWVWDSPSPIVFWPSI
jgi:hypothetical protein